MRESLRLILVDAIPEVEMRVFEPSAAGPDTEKPYLVVREGAQEAGVPYANVGTVMEVWPYVKQTTFQQVDAISQKITDTLHRKRFDSLAGEPFYIEYLGTAGPDVVDDNWKALTRGLRFQTYSLAWLTGETMDPDPVSALQRWTGDRFPELQTDPHSWAPSNEQPALYWRLQAITGIEPMGWGAWLTAQIRGHVIAPGVKQSVAWVKRIVQQLALDKRVKLDDGSRMSMQTISADSTADPFTAGQLQMTVRFGVLQQEIDSDVLKKAYINTDDGAGGVVE